MFITLETDYAIRIVHCLAKHVKKNDNGSCRLDGKTISEKTGVSLRFSLKILRTLVANSIIKSYKGSQGGYELARSAETISLYDVISIFEGVVSISRCLDNDYCCTHTQEGGCCCFKTVFDEISAEIKVKLSNVTFAE